MKTVKVNFIGFLFLCLICSTSAETKTIQDRESRLNTFRDGNDNFIFLDGNFNTNGQLPSGLSNTAFPQSDNLVNPLSAFQPQSADGPLALIPQNIMSSNTGQPNLSNNNQVPPSFNLGNSGGLQSNPLLFQLPNSGIANNPSQSTSGMLNNPQFNNFQNNGLGGRSLNTPALFGQGFPGSFGNLGFSNNPGISSPITNQGSVNGQVFPALFGNKGSPGSLMGGLPGPTSFFGIQGGNGFPGFGISNGLNQFPAVGGASMPNGFNNNINNRIPLLNRFQGLNGIMGNNRFSGPNSFVGLQRTPGLQDSKVYSSLNPFSEENNLSTDVSVGNIISSNIKSDTNKASSGRSNSEE